uniref:Tyrosine-protein phosphatase domain-containing protein n=1 Tax=Angiostrongylus cantonensis TaxID=6313 RepID=A0A0K0DMX7_ANGCA
MHCHEKEWAFFLKKKRLRKQELIYFSIHIFNPVPLRIHMNCGIYEGESGKENLAVYARNRTVRKEKIGLINNKCQSIKKRRYLPVAVPHSMEVHHNMYLLRIVSKDYDFLEEVMTMMFSPLHFYCFVIDSSVRILGECILNIIVPSMTFNTSTAHGTFIALNACYIGMERFPWKHSIITTVLSPDFDKNVALEVCHTNYYDEMGNCIIGMEDYDDITKSRSLFVRADPDFDYGIIQCVEQLIRIITYNHGSYRTVINLETNQCLRSCIDY